MTAAITLKSLYLDGQQPLAVSLDGPALRVDTEGRSPGRYPLRRLSRVIISGQVEMATKALTACLRSGIVVSFLDADGELAGLCLGNSTAYVNLHERFAEFAMRPDWHTHYANWFAAMERRRILVFVRRLALHVDDLRPRTVRQSFSDWLQAQCPPRDLHRNRGYLESAVAACAARTAQDCGIGPGILHDATHDMHLTRDLGRILAWDARLLTAWLLTETTRHAPPTRSELARAFEQRMGSYIRLTQDCLAYLEWVVQSLERGPESRTR